DVFGEAVGPIVYRGLEPVHYLMLRSRWAVKQIERFIPFFKNSKAPTVFVKALIREEIFNVFHRGSAEYAITVIEISRQTLSVDFEIVIINNLMNILAILLRLLVEENGSVAHPVSFCYFHYCDLENLRLKSSTISSQISFFIN